MSFLPFVPLDDFPAKGWQRKVRDGINALIRQRSVGPSSDRPLSPNVGDQHYDVTLHRPVWWDGAAWVDATGANA